MPEAEEEGPPRRVRRVVVVADLVESVRLMQEHEDLVIARWRAFVAVARQQTLPDCGGRMVKSLGDGMLLEFASVAEALRAIRALQGALAASNDAPVPGPQLHLRFGMHVADLVVDEFDVFGSGVNVAARLAALAGPGQAALSAEARAHLVPGLDGDIVDMGECYLKHIDRPVRAFRLLASADGAAAAGPPPRDADTLRPLVAVLPVAVAAADDGRHRALVAALTDDLVAILSLEARWAVVSRLSTAALQGRELQIPDARRILGADFVVRATLAPASDGAHVTVALHEARHGEVLDARQWACGDHALEDPARWPTAEMADFVASTILARQLGAPHQPALPNVPSYALLLRAIGLLHRLGDEDFAASKQMLDHLVERHPRSPEALAWSAKWHFLQLAQVTRTDLSAQVMTARARLAQGLDARPTHAMSLALEGHLLSFVDGDTAQSEYVLRRAVEHGPNESLAWMYLSGVLTHTGRGAEAVEAIRKAMVRSPLDPMNYDMDLFAADAYKAAGDLVTALAHAERSVRHNAVHLSSWIQLIILQMLNGQADQARASAAHYLVLRPAASVRRFVDRHPARGTAAAERDAAALREAGIPR